MEFGNGGFPSVRKGGQEEGGAPGFNVRPEIEQPLHLLHVRIHHSWIDPSSFWATIPGLFGGKQLESTIFFLNKERMKYSHFLYQDRKKLSPLLVQNVIPKTSGRRLVHLDGISAASRSQKRSVALRVALLLDAPATISVRQIAAVHPWSVFRASAARLESIQP